MRATPRKALQSHCGGSVDYFMTLRSLRDVPMVSPWTFTLHSIIHRGTVAGRLRLEVFTMGSRCCNEVSTKWTRRELITECSRGLARAIREEVEDCEGFLAIDRSPHGAFTEPPWLLAATHGATPLAHCTVYIGHACTTVFHPQARFIECFNPMVRV